MKIILEGPDGAGKSSLASELWRHLPAGKVEVVHTSQPRIGMEAFNEYVNKLTAPLEKSIIYDRLHIGERIYGPMYRNRSEVNSAQYHFLNAKIQAAGAIIVYVTADTETLVKRCQDRGESFTKLEDLASISSSYSDLVMKAEAHGVICKTHFTSGPARGKISTILDLAHRAQGGALHTAAPGLGYVGPSDPHTVYICHNHILAPYRGSNNALFWNGLPKELHGKIGVVQTDTISQKQLHLLYRHLGEPFLQPLDRPLTGGLQNVPTALPTKQSPRAHQLCRGEQTTQEQYTQHLFGDTQ